MISNEHLSGSLKVCTAVGVFPLASLETEMIHFLNAVRV